MLTLILSLLEDRDYAKNLSLFLFGDPWHEPRFWQTSFFLETHKVIEYFVANDPHHLKALLAGHAVHDHVAVNANKVLAIQNSVFILTCCIYDLHRKILIPIPDELGEGVLDGRVVRVDKVAVNELDCEARLA